MARNLRELTNSMDTPDTANGPKSRASLSSIARAVSGNQLAILGLFLAAALLIYSPALNGGLIWDDDYLVGQNPFFKSPVFIFEVFRHYLFFDSFSTYYRPVQNLTYMVDYWLWAGSPFGYHLTNILLHSVSGFLLFKVLRRILPPMLEDTGGPGLSDGISFLVSMIWTVHPIHNAAVAYISGRADSIASLFALSAWLVALRAQDLRGGKRAALFVVAALSLLAALCAKEIALMWMVIFLLHLIAFRTGETWRIRLALIGGLLVVFALYFCLHSLPEHRAPMEDGPAAPIAARFLLMLRALGDYSGLIFYPSRLLMDRTLTSPAMYANEASWYASLRYEYLSVIGCAVLAVGALLCRNLASGRKLRIFGALWFIAAFLPISNLFPLNAQVAEHWIYLASIGYFVFLAGCALLLAPRWRRILVCASIAAVCALGIRTARRAADWSDATTFYTRTIEDGGGTPRIFGNLAGTYAMRGDYARQEVILRRTLALFPTFVTARINLGICLVNQGRSEEAESFLNFAKPDADEVSRRFPRTWSAALNLAGVRAKAGNTGEALAILSDARERSPDTWELAKYEADLLEHEHGASIAIPGIEKYAAAHWWHEDAWLMLGQLRAAAGDAQAAVDAMQYASRLDIHDAKPFANIARIEISRNRPDAACTAQRAAIARDPNQPSRYLVFAAILDQLGRREEAAAALQHAAELRASVLRRDSQIISAPPV